MSAREEKSENMDMIQDLTPDLDTDVLHVNGIRMLAKSFRTCVFILDELLSCFYCYQFLEPVPSTAVVYHQEIKTPMDFRTLEYNLYNDNYKDFEEFTGDLCLIWKNAMQFHRKFDAIYIQADNLCKRFESIVTFLNGGERPFYLSTLADNINTITSTVLPEEQITEVFFPMYKEIEPKRKSNLYFVQAFQDQDPLEKKIRSYANVRVLYQNLNSTFFHYVESAPNNRCMLPLPRFYIAKNRTLLHQARVDPDGTLAVLFNVRSTPIADDITQIKATVVHCEPMNETHDFDENTMDKSHKYEYCPKAWLKLKIIRVIYDVEATINVDMERNFFRKAYNTFKLSTTMPTDIKKVGNQELAKEFAQAILEPRTGRSKSMTPGPAASFSSSIKSGHLNKGKPIPNRSSPTTRLKPTNNVQKSQYEIINKSNVSVSPQSSFMHSIEKVYRSVVDTGKTKEDSLVSSSNSSTSGLKDKSEHTTVSMVEPMDISTSFSQNEGTNNNNTNITKSTGSNKKSTEWIFEKSTAHKKLEHTKPNDSDTTKNYIRIPTPEVTQQSKLKQKKLNKERGNQQEHPHHPYQHQTSYERQSNLHYNNEKPQVLGASSSINDQQASDKSSTNIRIRLNVARENSPTMAETSKKSKLKALNTRASTLDDETDTDETASYEYSDSEESDHQDTKQDLSIENNNTSQSNAVNPLPYSEDETHENVVIKSEYQPALLTQVPLINSVDELWQKLADYSQQKNVPVVDVNQYEFYKSSLPNAEGYFKHVFYATYDKQKVIQTFKRMSISQRITEIVGLLTLKDQKHIGQITDLLQDANREIIGLCMKRYEKTLKEYTHAHSHYRLTAHQKMDLVIQMLQSLKIIHAAGIAHRDLSEVNFMVNSTEELLNDGSKKAELYLIDFGKSTFINPIEYKRWWVEPPENSGSSKRSSEVIPKTREELDYWCQKLPWVRSKPDHGYRLYRSIQTLPKTRLDNENLPWLVNPIAEDLYSIGTLIWKTFAETEPWYGMLDTDLKGLREKVGDDFAIEKALQREVHGDLSRQLLLKFLKVDPLQRKSATDVLEWISNVHIQNGLIREWERYAPVSRQKRHAKLKYDEDPKAERKKKKQRQLTG